MAFIKNLTLIALLLISGGEAKVRNNDDQVVVHKSHDRKTRHAPIVEGSECSTTCLF